MKMVFAISTIKMMVVVKWQKRGSSLPMWQPSCDPGPLLILLNTWSPLLLLLHYGFKRYRREINIRKAAGQKVNGKKITEKGGTPPPPPRKAAWNFFAENGQFGPIFNRFFLNGKGGYPSPPITESDLEFVCRKRRFLPKKLCFWASFQQIFS